MVTAAVSSYQAGFSGFQTNFDVFGWNYKPMNYAEFRRRNPDILAFSAARHLPRSASHGYYVFPTPGLNAGKEDRAALGDFQVSSYDVYVPNWATLPDAEFLGEDQNPFVAGEFVWTGFDYLGEPTPYHADATNLLSFYDPSGQARAVQELQTLGRNPDPFAEFLFWHCGFGRL